MESAEFVIVRDCALVNVGERECLAEGFHKGHLRVRKHVWYQRCVCWNSLPFHSRKIFWSRFYTEISEWYPSFVQIL